jgi:hypothetical protein
LIGPVSRSVRRGARRAHLHEVRRLHQPQHQHHLGSEDEDVFIATAAGSCGHRAAAQKMRSTQARPAAVAAFGNDDVGVGGGLRNTTVVGTQSWGGADGGDGPGAGAGAADAWVDTDTDPDDDDDGQFKVDLD